MNGDMLDRIRMIFKESGKNQTEIAKLLNVTSAYIWKIYNNDSVSPRSMFIDSVCREFNINSEWLKTGKGDKTLSRNQEIIEFMNNAMQCDDKDFKKRFIHSVAKMSMDEWVILEKLIDRINEEKG